MRSGGSRYRKLDALLSELYQDPACQCLAHDHEEEEPPKINEQVLRHAYQVVIEEEEMTPEMLTRPAVRKLIKSTDRSLQRAIKPAISGSMPEAMQRKLKEDVFVFAGFKSYHQLKEASERLVDTKTNKVKSFDQFWQDTESIRDKYNKSWLRAEYNYAVRSSEMAARWAEIEADGEDIDLLYCTMGDAKVRPEHAQLDGVCLPPNDPFWEVAYPPNGWNCRCNVERVERGTHSYSNRSRALEDFEASTPKLFRGNTGKTQTIYPDRHPYYSKRGYKHCSVTKDKLAADLSPDEECEILRHLHPHANAKTKYVEEIAIAREILARAEREGSNIIKVGDGEIEVESDINPEERYKNFYTARYLAQKHAHAITLSKDAGGKRSADSYNKTLKHKVEYKHLESNSKNSFNKNIREGAKQAKHLALVIKGEYPKGDLKDALKNRFTQYKDLQSTILIFDYKHEVYLSREDILQDKIPL